MMQGKAPKGSRRSSKWRRVRAEHLKKNPKCAACGSSKKIEVHHLFPFHLFPDLELRIDNLITLCERKKYGVNCHLAWGHNGRYTDFNANVEIDTKAWMTKLKSYGPVY